MRIPLIAASAAFLLVASVAHAQQPIDPYASGSTAAEPTDEPAPPAPPTVVAPVTPLAPVDAPTVIAPAPPAAPLAPLPPLPPAAPSPYPPPPAFGYQPPAAGPSVVVPGAPAYQQGYYLYAVPGQAPPVYYAPPPVAYCPRASYQYQPCGCSFACAPRRKWDGVRRFSLGGHFTAMTLNQTVGGKAVTLFGGGLQLRIRSKGRFGFEAAQSFLHASFWGDRFERWSYPFQASLMLYVFPNRDSQHFNLYALAGAGIMSDSISVFDENNRKVWQSFTEFEGHVGVGAELRFRWFAIEADGRLLGLLRDNSDFPAKYYGDAKGAPVPKDAAAVQGNVYLSLWF